VPYVDPTGVWRSDDSKWWWDGSNWRRNRLTPLGGGFVAVGVMVLVAYLALVVAIVILVIQAFSSGNQVISQWG
jgi:hypothetical protein